MHNRFEAIRRFCDSAKTRFQVKEYPNLFPKSDYGFPLLLYNFHPDVLKQAFAQSTISEVDNEISQTVRVALFFGDSNGQLFSMLPELVNKIDIILISNSSMREYRYTKFLLECFEKSPSEQAFYRNHEIKNPQLKEIKKKLMRETPEIFSENYRFFQLTSGKHSEEIVDPKNPRISGGFMPYRSSLEITLHNSIDVNPMTLRGHFPRELSEHNFLNHDDSYQRCKAAFSQLCFLPITLDPLDSNACLDFVTMLQEHAAHLSFVSLNRMHEYQNNLALYYKNMYALLAGADHQYLMYCVANGEKYDNKICRHIDDYLNDPLITSTPSLQKDLPAPFQAIMSDNHFLGDLAKAFPIYEKINPLKCSYPLSNEPGYQDIIEVLANQKSYLEEGKLRVGLLIGESCFLSLAELINHVDVLILNDIDAVVHKHNAHLINCIRNSRNRADFECHYKNNNPLVGEKLTLYTSNKKTDNRPQFWPPVKQRRAFITDLWEAIRNPSEIYRGGQGLGEYYFYHSDERFQACKNTIDLLKIVQTNIDLMDLSSCEKLADMLDSHNAVITFINLTNVHDYQHPKNQLAETIPALLRNTHDPLVMFANSYRWNNRLHTNISRGLSDYFEKALGSSIKCTADTRMRIA